MNLSTDKHLTRNDGFYFPLFNLIGLRASITPFYGGDLKKDHHHYGLQPTTELDLYHSMLGRNIIFEVDGVSAFLNGAAPGQKEDELTYQTKPFEQTVTRTNTMFRLEGVSFIPVDAMVELHQVTFENLHDKPLKVRVTTAIPLYGRSADNLRDHRHVTSLLNVIDVVDHGIMLKPTLSFDERGHQLNDTVYSVFAKSGQLEIDRYIPILDDFVNGGSLHDPRGLDHHTPANTTVKGYEAIGAIGFKTITLAPKASFVLYLSIGIHDDRKDALEEGMAFLNETAFAKAREQMTRFFEDRLKGLSFVIADEATSRQLSWVSLQPLLRRYYGNSFLPHHDYGRGGRGWRDLWQDLLALIMTNDDGVVDLLTSNFAGIRIDGSNATIIGDAPGEFKADRNQITRVWSDHGAWPLLTTKMYIDETGDIGLLMKTEPYFTDQFTHYTKRHRPLPEGRVQLDGKGNVYQGTILEHLLLQNLIAHHNTGAHGFIRLEDADWNDGLDMAHGQGETIAFTHMYANNLRLLSDLVMSLPGSHVMVFQEMLMLFDDNPDLGAFFDAVASFKGSTVALPKEGMAKRLSAMADVRIHHLHTQAYQHGRYESYLDNDGQWLDTPQTLTLTGQAMALLSLTPTPEQAKTMANTTKARLYHPGQGGYRLNSDYGRVLTSMGRAFGFAYGHKENGAVFSHMAVMYAYGLYQYGLIEEGHETFMALLKRAQDDDARVWAGIPEYFNDRGIGMYPYLTGSASWMLKLLRTEVFGIKLEKGVLWLFPKLSKPDFINGKASITTYLFGRLTTITYHNKQQLDHGGYQITSIKMNGQTIDNGITRITGDIEVTLA